ncbi:hypothetical protein [Brevundimonas sp.]|uniref:hypothetical protein n=1 Tax=Brevundimonas sp. TaxID=1871086 RepID=UPI001D8DE7EA|nr:hypothetical protein [Brevundimonas sp.]MBA4001092.1 hypothetical protein [Brevundimonas sp.]
MGKKLRRPRRLEIIIAVEIIVVAAIIVAFQLSMRDALIASAVAGWLGLEAYFSGRRDPASRSGETRKKPRGSGPWA